MALSFHPTTAPGAADMTSFLHDAQPDVSDDGLLGFVYDVPLDAVLDDFLDLHSLNAAAFTTGPVSDAAAAAFLGPMKNEFLTTECLEPEQHCDKNRRTACNYQQEPTAMPEFAAEFVMAPLPPPLPLPQPRTFARGSEDAKIEPRGNVGHQSVAARERRRRISQKTAELSRLIPGGQRLSTAEMLHEAARYVKLLQAQVGVLALMHTVYSSENEKTPAVMATREQMHALLVSGSVQERLAAEGKCLVPRKLVDAVAKDKAVKSNPLLNRDLARFMASLEQE